MEIVSACRRRGTRTCLLLVALVSVQYSCGEEVTALHGAGYDEADQPTWHDISTLSDGDLHMLAGYAKKYAKQGQALQGLDDNERKLERERMQRLAREKEKALSEPPHDPESTSAVLAPLQQKLALKLTEIDNCNAKLRECLRNSDVKATGKSDSAHHLAPTRLGEDRAENDEDKDKDEDEEKEVRRIHFPRTTAQEDWDREHKNQEPYEHIWRQKPGEKITSEKETAMQEYERSQQKFPKALGNDHSPGHKLEHDRIFDESAAEMAAEAKGYAKVADDSLSRTYKAMNETMTAAEHKARVAQSRVEIAQAQVIKDKQVRLPNDEEKAITNAEGNLKKCKSDLAKCSKL